MLHPHPALAVQSVRLRARSERSLGIRAHGETFAPTGTRKAHCFLVVGKLGQAKGGAEWNARVARRRTEVEYVIDRSTCLMCDLRLIRVALAHAVSTSSNQEQ